VMAGSDMSLSLRVRGGAIWMGMADLNW